MISYRPRNSTVNLNEMLEKTLKKNADFSESDTLENKRIQKKWLNNTV